MRIKCFEEGKTKEILELDYYVPISLEFPLNDVKNAELYYYRFINEESSFIEVKVNSESKKIAGVTVTSINAISDNTSELNDFNNTIENNPQIETAIFAENTVITIRTHFKIYKKDRSLYFSIEDKEITNIKISNHLTLFLNSKNEIVGMRFSDFSEDQWESITSSFNNCKL